MRTRLGLNPLHCELPSPSLADDEDIALVQQWLDWLRSYKPDYHSASLKIADALVNLPEAPPTGCPPSVASLVEDSKARGGAEACEALTKFIVALRARLRKHDEACKETKHHQPSSSALLSWARRVRQAVPGSILRTHVSRRICRSAAQEGASKVSLEGLQEALRRLKSPFSVMPSDSSPSLPRESCGDRTSSGAVTCAINDHGGHDGKSQLCDASAQNDEEERSWVMRALMDSPDQEASNLRTSCGAQ